MSDPNLKVNAMLSALQQQRDAANNTVVQLAAQVAELEARIKELEGIIEDIYENQKAKYELPIETQKDPQ